MYRILVVDDEMIIRNGIKTTLDWEALGYEIIGTAPNAKEAFEMYEELKPDIIISDIKMPEYTGLDLLEWIKKEETDTEVLFLSGYSDFEFVRKGLVLGAYDYLLKTDLFTELEGVMMKLKAYLDNKRSTELAYKNSMNKKNNFLFFQLLRGEENIEIIDVRKKYYGMVTLWCELDENQLEFFSSYTSKTPYVMGKDREITCYIFWSDEKNSVMDAMELLLDKAEGWLGHRQYVMKYTLIENIQEISLMFRHAMKMTDTDNYLKQTGNNYLFKPRGTVVGLESYYEMAKYIASSIRRGKCEKGSEEITGLFNQIFEDEGITYFDVMQILQFFLMEIMNTIETLDEEMKVVGKQLIENLTKEISIIHMHKMMQKYLTELKKIFSKATKTDLESRIQESRRFIEEHYRESLKMPDVASRFYLSPAYFSVQFTKIIGMSFSAYLTDIRLNMAHEYLTHSKDKIYEIAAAVGYQDERHFSKQFKAKFGISPKALQKVHK